MASPRRDPLAALDRVLAPLTAAAAAFAIVVLIAGPDLIGAKKSAAEQQAAQPAAPTPAATEDPATQLPEGEPGEEPTAAPTQAAGADGKAIFASAGCAGCHTLAAAGSTGSIGPNLDNVKPSADTVQAVVKSGSGAMPSFEGELSEAEIIAVAEFVSSSAGG
jgi:mono/diheme cytochrome c family protein